MTAGAEGPTPTGPELTDDQDVARLLGLQGTAMVALWRTMGIRWWRHVDGDGAWVLAYSSGTLVGRQRLDALGRPAGRYVVIVNERED